MPTYGAPVHRLVVEPDDGRAAIIEAIGSAPGPIDLTIYEINDSEIVDALVRARTERGIEVRVVYNYYSFQGHHDPNQATVQTFENAGITTHRAWDRYPYTHEKTFAFGEGLALIMSFNLTADYFGGTRDYAIFTSDPGEVAEIRHVFDHDIADTEPEISVPSLVWSPVNSRARILAVINGARKSLEVCNEELADRQVLDALLTAVKDRHVSVRLLSAVLGSGQDANAAAREELRRGGVEAYAYSRLYMHAKMVLADFGEAQQQAYVGSENFSATSLDRNRELGIVVREVDILQRLHRTFESDWAGRDPD